MVRVYSSHGIYVLVRRRYIAPTEVRCEFLKSSFFVVAVFLWSNRVVIKINVHLEATETPTWSLGGEVKDEKIK